MSEKPNQMFRYKDFEYYKTGTVEGSKSFGKFEIWKDDEKVHEGIVNESSGRLDYAMDAAERAAEEWIDTQAGSG